MKKIFTGNISDTAKQPITRASLDLLNDNTTDFQKVIGRMSEGLSSSLDSTNGVVLHGLINTGTLIAPNISAGAIFYNNSIYLVDSFSSASITNSIGLNIVTTYDSNDPILFSDNTSHNVHQIVKGVIVDSATYDLLYTNLVFLNQINELTLTNSMLKASTGTVTCASSTTKVIRYIIDWAKKQLTMNFEINVLSFGDDNVAGLYMMLPASLKCTKNFFGTGWFYNSFNTTSETSGQTKQTLCRISANNTITTTGDAIYIRPERSSFVNFQTNSVNLQFYGTIVLTFD